MTREKSTMPALDLARLRAWTKSGEARAIRENAQLYRNDIALSIGVHEATIFNWECGRRQPTGPSAARYYSLLLQLREEFR